MNFNQKLRKLTVSSSPASLGFFNDDPIGSGRSSIEYTRASSGGKMTNARSTVSATKSGPPSPTATVAVNGERRSATEATFGPPWGGTSTWLLPFTLIVNEAQVLSHAGFAATFCAQV